MFEVQCLPVLLRRPQAARRRWRVAVVLASALTVAACAARPEAGHLSPVAATETAGTRDVLVATTRSRDPRPGTLYSGERSERLDYARIKVSIPPSHRVGEIEWPSRPPGDSRRDFTVQNAAYLPGEKAFVDALKAQLAARPKGRRKVMIFIHGYNTAFAEAVYRTAQIAHDARSPAVPVLFTWASRGRIGQYIYDHNSATVARDDLEHVIRLAFATGPEQVNILAHSMGSWIAVEALRQIKISGRPPDMSRLGSIFLAAPDLDVDVFKSQMRRFGRPRKPFYIVLSKDDKALAVSDFIAGTRSRLGSYQNTDELTALGAVVIDMTQVKAADPANHGKFAQLAEVAPELQTVLEAGVGNRRDRAVKQQGALRAVIALPISILSAPGRVVEDH